MLYAQQSTFHFQDIYDWTDYGILPNGVRVQGNVSLDDIQSWLENNEVGLPTIGIPVEFHRDQIQFGKLLSKQIEDCLVIKNAEHPSDYFRFVFTVRTTGNFSTISFYRSGFSSRNYQMNRQNEFKNSGTLLGSIAGVFTKTDKRGLDEEEDYYSMAAGVIRGIFGC